MSLFRSRISKPRDLYCRALRIPWCFPFASYLWGSFMYEQVLTHESDKKSPGDSVPERIKPSLRVALCLCRLTGDEIYRRIGDRTHDRPHELRRLAPHGTAGCALTHHVVELRECVPDELLALFRDAVGHCQLPHRSTLQGVG